jgi:hypothetical protein
MNGRGARCAYARSVGAPGSHADPGADAISTRRASGKLRVVCAVVCHRTERGERKLVCTREPSGSRASTQGDVASTGRPGAPRCARSRGGPPPPPQTDGQPSRSADNAPLHGARHFFATLSLAGGARLDVISRQLGHASVAIPADVYGHPDDDAAAAAAAALGEILGKSQSPEGRSTLRASCVSAGRWCRRGDLNPHDP